MKKKLSRYSVFDLNEDARERGKVGYYRDALKINATFFFCRNFEERRAEPGDDGNECGQLDILNLMDKVEDVLE